MCSASSLSLAAFDVGEMRAGYRINHVLIPYSRAYRMPSMHGRLGSKQEQSPLGTHGSTTLRRAGWAVRMKAS
jgi:hypothetical protein